MKYETAEWPVDAHPNRQTAWDEVAQLLIEGDVVAVDVSPQGARTAMDRRGLAIIAKRRNGRTYIKARLG